MDFIKIKVEVVRKEVRVNYRYYSQIRIQVKYL